MGASTHLYQEDHGRTASVVNGGPSLAIGPR